MLEEAADGGATTIAGRNGVRAVGFDVIKKSGDRLGIEIAQFQRSDLSRRRAANSNSSLSASR
jgi:hypothetical protein